MHEDIEAIYEQIKKEENFITKAKLLRFLVVDKEIRIKDISKKIGIKESYICHILRLNKLTDMIIDGYYSKLISISHLFIISRLKTNEEISKAYEKVLSESLTVGQTEELIREMLYQTKTVGEHLSKDEIDKSRQDIKLLFDGVGLKIVQTRIKSRCILDMKGSLAETTPLIRQILKKLIS